MGRRDDELPPAKGPLRPKSRPWYKRSSCLIPLGLFLALVFFFNHNVAEGEMVTGAAAGAAAAENASALNVEGVPKSLEEIVEAREHAAEAVQEAKEAELTAAQK